MNIPDAIELHGYRMWLNTPHGLRAVAHNDYWQPGPNTATCAKKDSKHSAPADKCACGFYLLPTLDGALERMMTSRFMVARMMVVFGKVSMWGKVIEHEKGYRAQYAQVVQFYEPDGWDRSHRRTAGLFDRFQVPVETLPIDVSMDVIARKESWLTMTPEQRMDMYKQFRRKSWIGRQMKVGDGQPTR